jgi:hypothetical protein
MSGTVVRGPRYYEEYSEYAKTLRTWLVAYGIGGPVILLTQPSLYNKVLASNQGDTLAVVFLCGVVLQVLSALVYKAATWKLHESKEILDVPVPGWAKRIEQAYWVDVVVDLTTIVLFAWPTYQLIKILGASANCHSCLTSACS